MAEGVEPSPMQVKPWHFQKVQGLGYGVVGLGFGVQGFLSESEDLPGTDDSGYQDLSQGLHK